MKSVQSVDDITCFAKRRSNSRTVSLRNTRPEAANARALFDDEEVNIETLREVKFEENCFAFVHRQQTL